MYNYIDYEQLKELIYRNEKFRDQSAGSQEIEADYSTPLLLRPFNASKNVDLAAVNSEVCQIGISKSYVSGT